jgi:CDP-glucose 4,6-dehydratase
MQRDHFWKERHVFITGASGFLGGWLCQALVQLGAEVTVLVRDERPKTYLRLSGISDKLNIVRGSLASYHLLERSLSEYSIDTCFHLAAQSLVPVANRSPLTTFESNVRGSWNLLEAARRNALLERLVIASSDKAYGNQQKLPLREDYELSSSYPYETSKVCADSIAQCYYRTYGVPLAITRCSNLYGGGDLNYSRIIPGTIRSLLENERRRSLSNAGRKSRSEGHPRSGLQLRRRQPHQRSRLGAEIDINQRQIAP